MTLSQRRTALGLLITIGAGVLMVLLPSAASAAPERAGAVTQATCDPGDYPPEDPAIESSLMITDGHLLPGASDGTLTLSGATTGAIYYGSLFSTEVALPETTASDSGQVQYTGLAIPSDFALGAQHSVDVYRDCTLVGQFTFCVTALGEISTASTCTAVDAAAGSGDKAAAAARGSLPKTGWDHLVQILKIAVLAIAVGVFLLYVRRRRAASALQA